MPENRPIGFVTNFQGWLCSVGYVQTVPGVWYLPRVVVVVLTLTRIIKSVVTGQAPVTLVLPYKELL